MKKLLILCLLAAQVVRANKDYELFLAGNQLAQSGKYQDALDAYNGIKSSSSAICYNRGLTHYALGNYLEALGDFRRAERTASGALFDKVKSAVNTTQNKLGLPEDAWFYSALLYAQKGSFLGWLQIALLYFLGIIVFVVYRRKKYNKQSFIFQLVGYSCVIFIIGLKIFAYYYIHQPYAIVAAKEAPVFVGPNKEFDMVGSLPQGLRVELVDENNSWCKMHCRDMKGWVQEKDLCIIKDHK